MKSVAQILGLILVLFCSGCVGQDLTIERDVQYGQVNGQKLLLDVYRPAAGQALRPAVLFVHGGGWSMGSKENFKDEAMGLAKFGYVTFSIDYRLAADGRNLWPAQLDDTQRAVRWVRAHADKYHIDPQRIGALGHSAGGQLVAFLGTRDTRDNSDARAGQLFKPGGVCGGYERSGGSRDAREQPWGWNCAQLVRWCAAGGGGAGRVSALISSMGKARLS